MDPLSLARQVGDTLDELGIAWVLGGSLASSLAGEPRSTMDIDLAVVMTPLDVDRLAAAVADRFYMSVEMARYATAHGSSFNLLDQRSSYKVDLFVLGDSELDRRQLERRVLHHVEVSGQRLALWIGSPDTQILRKLDWFQAGGETSERQWRDVTSLLRVQRQTLDLEEIRATAARLGLDRLLERAIAECGR